MQNLLIGAALFAAATLPAQANAFRTWNWQFSSYAFHASGTFVTTATPDAEGYYRILRLTGTRNGLRVVALAPPGRPIPGNAPYAVDNRIRAASPQLTKAGFGFELKNKNWSNPFFLNGKYLEYLSLPPYRNGAGPEGPISFSAKPAGP